MLLAILSVIVVIVVSAQRQAVVSNSYLSIDLQVKQFQSQVLFDFSFNFNQDATNKLGQIMITFPNTVSITNSVIVVGSSTSTTMKYTKMNPQILVIQTQSTTKYFPNDATCQIQFVETTATTFPIQFEINTHSTRLNYLRQTISLDVALPVINMIGSGKTFEKSRVKLVYNPTTLTLGQPRIDIEFPYLSSFTYQCTYVSGLDLLSQCERYGNIIRISNQLGKNWSPNQYELWIDNVDNPPTIGLNSNYKITTATTAEEKAIGTLQVNEVSQFDLLTITGTSDYSSTNNDIKLHIYSKYYILSNSDAIITLSHPIVITKVKVYYQNTLLKDTFTQTNSNTITISNISTQLIQQPAIDIVISAVNTGYKSTLSAKLTIKNNGDDSLSSIAYYSIKPNKYQQFSISRSTQTVNEVAQLTIDIVLSNPISNGYIVIEFPSELNMPVKTEYGLSGKQFKFIYTITNLPTKCASSTFKSFAYNNDQQVEQLYDDITLSQIEGVIVGSIQFIPTQYSINQNMNITFQLQIPHQHPQQKLIIIVPSTFTLNSQSKCSITSCQISIDSNTITIVDPSIRAFTIQDIRSPRSIAPFTWVIGTTYINCPIDSMSYLSRVPIPGQLNIIALPQSLLSSDITTWRINTQIPISLKSTDYVDININITHSQLECLILQPIYIKQECNTLRFNNVQYLVQASQLSIEILKLQNPSTQIPVLSQISIFDAQGYYIASGNYLYNKWIIPILKYSSIDVPNKLLNQTKEAIISILLTKPITHLLIQIDQQIYCRNCQNQQDSILIQQQSNPTTIQIPIMIILTQQIVNYSIKTYSNDQLQEEGTFSQVIQLQCHSSCAQCQNTYNTCTQCYMGYLYQQQCIDTCPQGYYGNNQSCYPCQVSQCVVCASEEVQCLECQQGYILQDGKCIEQQTTQQTQHTTTPEIEQPTILPEYQVIYEFPSIILIVCCILLFVLLTKIKYRPSQSKTVFYAFLSLLEYGLGVFIFVNFCILELYNLAFLTLSILVAHMVQQIYTVFHLNVQLSIDPLYLKSKQQLSVKLVHYITLGFSFQFQTLLTSKLTAQPHWNCGWTMKESVMRMLTTALKSTLVYSLYQVCIMIASIIQTREVHTMFIEIIGVNITTIILNVYHQYKYNQMLQQIDTIG